MIADTAQIHPTAIVAPGAHVGDRTTIGPYATLGPDVRLGPDNAVGAYAVIAGQTSIGSANRLFSHSVIGAEPQVSDWRGGLQRVQIGDDNIFREFVTVSGSADGAESCTSIGSHNMLMATSHIGHDCTLGDRIHIANGGTLAGHVVIEDHAWISGLSAVHQFVRVGIHAFVAGGAIVTQDVPPFCLVQGDRARLVSLNEIGLRRAGIKSSGVRALRLAYRKIFLGSRSLAERLEELEVLASGDANVAHLLYFLRSSQRGCITTTRRAA